MKFIFFNKNLKIFINFFWFISVIYLLYKIIENFNQSSVEITIKFDQLFFIFILFLVISNISSFRFFFFLKKLNKYPINFIDWSSLFFKTSLINLLFQGSGDLIRAIELKKKHVGYVTFINTYFFIFILQFFFFNVFFIILLYFIREETIFLLYLYTSILILFFLVKKKTLFFILINFIKKKLSFYKKRFTLIIKKLSLNYDIFFLPKNLLIFFFFTLVIFLLQVIIFHIIIKNILPSSTFFQILLIFLFTFFMGYVPIIKNLFGINELLVGMFVETLDFHFFSGAIIQLILRSMSGISDIALSLFYYLLSLNRKNLK
jgi:hypothetical protein